jgi:Spy/CpxP family protein refolding chaperone
MKKGTVFTVAITLLFIAQLTYAGQWSRGPGMMGPGMGPPIGTGYCMSIHGASQLGLTPEQSQRLKSLWEAYFKDLIPIRNQIFGKRAELRLLWAEANPNKERILAKQKEINELEWQIEERTINYRLECLNVLTPDQKAKLFTLGPAAGFGYGHGPWMGIRGRW